MKAMRREFEGKYAVFPTIRYIVENQRVTDFREVPVPLSPVISCVSALQKRRNEAVKAA